MTAQESNTDTEWGRQYIDGEWVAATDGETIPIKNPTTRETFTEVPAATEADVNAAYEAAKAAQPEWEAMGRGKRNKLVEAALGELEDRFTEITDLLAREGGSASGKASGEVAISMSDFQTALQLEPPEEDIRDSQFINEKKHHIVTEPVGVVGIISPWNYPLHLTTRALAPALALGNTEIGRAHV